MPISGVRKSLSLLGSRGFTLVEMMAAVAITGILIAVAVPKYTAFTAKARQSEATQELSKIYVQEHLFLTEWGFYSSCLTQMGYKPNVPTRYYAVGFTRASAIATLCGTDGQTACNKIGSITCAAGAITGGESETTYDTVFASNVYAGGSLKLAKNANFPTTGVGLTAFSAGAVGNVNSSATVFDKWTIDDKKTIINTQSGM